MNNGKGKRLIKGIVMNPSKEKGGYLKVRFKSCCKAKNYRVHILVALAFIPNPKEKKEVNHKDGDKHNNNCENLEWSTRSENMKHAYKNKLAKVNKTCKSVIKIDPITGEHLRDYQSIKEASDELGILSTGISAVLNGKRNTAGGYRWEFKR